MSRLATDVFLAQLPELFTEAGQNAACAHVFGC